MAQSVEKTFLEVMVFRWDYREINGENKNSAGKLNASSGGVSRSETHQCPPVADEPVLLDERDS